MKALAVAWGVAASAVTALAAAQAPAAEATCGPFPKVDVAVPAGHCLARVADATRGLRFPRRLLEVAPNRFWVIDMGSWMPRQGRLLELRLDESAADPADRVRVTTLAAKLDRPLGLARGPDGRVYVGEAGRIWRTPVDGPLQQDVVFDDLPSDGAHPLKELAFGPDGRLYVNVGSKTDACRAPDGTQPVPCPEVAGDRPRAAVYVADPALTALRPFATGLRNSVALAAVGRTVLQGENSIDYADAGEPPEELNLLRDGSRHGWPYCTGDRRPARGYEKRPGCAGTDAPAQAWPAHVAPLHLLPVPAGSPSPFAGQVLVAWHGPRQAGHRVMAFRVDAAGRPSGAPQQVVGGWDAAPGRARGAPTGLAVDHAGRLWIAEDRNRSVLVLRRTSP